MFYPLLLRSFLSLSYVSCVGFSISSFTYIEVVCGSEQIHPEKVEMSLSLLSTSVQAY